MGGTEIFWTVFWKLQFWTAVEKYNWNQPLFPGDRFSHSDYFRIAFELSEAEASEKTLQMVSYAPYFISTVVICGMIAIFMDKDTGILNQMIMALGGKSQDFLSKRSILKAYMCGAGYGKVWGTALLFIYRLCRALTLPCMRRRLWTAPQKCRESYILIFPALNPLLLCFLFYRWDLWWIVGFEKVFLLQNDLNMSASDVINTYVYRVGLVQNNYSYSTAVGLFNSVINMALVILANQVSKKLANESLW